MIWLRRSAAQSSRRRKDCCFSGATLVFAATRDTEMDPSSVVTLRSSLSRVRITRLFRSAIPREVSRHDRRVTLPHFPAFSSIRDF